MKLAHALLHALKDYGALEIFGIPGDFILPFFREIEHANILPLYTLSHEPGVGFAADAASRYRSNLSVACVTYGAGALNMINPIAQAYAEKSPVVVISGAPGKQEANLGLGLHHQVKELASQELIYREITAAQAILNDPDTAPGEIARVLTTARELSRPVYIELPRDMTDRDVAPIPAYQTGRPAMDAARACAVEVMAALKSADNPAILLGVEVRRYGLETLVKQLLHKLGIPAATSFLARGILPESDTSVIGTYFGLAGDPEIRRTIESADTTFMLGVILCDTNFGVSSRNIDMRHAIHAFDREVRFAHHHYPDIPLATLIEALLEIAEPVGKAKHNATKPGNHTFPLDDAEILPSDIAVAVDDLFARHGPMPIASDMGDCLFTAMEMNNTDLIAPAYYATMGAGVPMGLGIQAACGKRPLILVGDGAFQMTGWELGNCRRYGWTPIVLVFNNLGWGMLKAFQDDTSYNDLEDWHFAELAGPLGGKGTRVATRKELGDALEKAHQDGTNWHLIEIMIPRGEISDTLQRFTQAIARKSALGKQPQNDTP